MSEHFNIFHFILQARESHRKLLNEWEQTNTEVHANTTRLDTLDQDIDMIREVGKKQIMCD